MVGQQSRTDGTRLSTKAGHTPPNTNPLKDSDLNVDKSPLNPCSNHFAEHVLHKRDMRHICWGFLFQALHLEGIAGRTLITVTNQDDQVVSSLHCAPGDPVAVEHCEYCEHCEHCEQMTGGGQDETPQEVPATPGQRVHLLQLSLSYKLIQRCDTKM